MSYYIGIDGGGTKTAYALFDSKKAMLSTVKTSGTNHENLEGAIPEAAKIIYSGICELLMKNAIEMSDISHCLMALAGIDHEFQRAAMEAELKKLGLSFPFSIYNDGFIVVKAGSTKKAAIGYNCGTGTCCNSIDSDGRLLQVGGFGELSGDVGGGHWIARMTYNLVYNDVCLKALPTSCTKAFCETFGVTADREGILSMIPTLEKEDDETVRPLIDIFFDAYNSGDEAAEEIGRIMTDTGAKFIVSHLKNGNFNDEITEVVLSGSIHTKLPSDKYTDALQKKAEELSGRKLKFIKLSVPPVMGCINWMLEK